MLNLKKEKEEKEMSAKSILVVYSYHDEVLVCTPESEKVMIEDYFKNTGRDIEDYDKEEYKDSVCISNGSLRIE